MNMQSIKNFGNRVAFSAKQNSDKLFFIGGLISLGITIYATHKATLNCEPILDKCNEDKSQFEEKRQKATDTSIPEEERPVYTEEEYKQDMRNATKTMIVDCIMQSAPVALSAASTVVFFGAAYKTISGRYATAVGAYTALERHVKRYRDANREEIGEEREEELWTGVRKEKAFVKEVTPEGEVKTVEKEVETLKDPEMIDGKRLVIFSKRTAPFVFQDGDMSKNLLMLRQKQHWYNQQVDSRGWLTEVEVRMDLGLPVTDECLKNNLGWIKDPADNKPRDLISNPYIDLHIKPLFSETGEHLMFDGQIVNECSSRNFLLQFDSIPIGDKVHVWEKRL